MTWRPLPTTSWTVQTYRGMVNRCGRTKARLSFARFRLFLLVLRPSWRWSLAKTPRCRGLAIFCGWRQQRQNWLLYPNCTCARGNNTRLAISFVVVLCSGTVVHRYFVVCMDFLLVKVSALIFLSCCSVCVGSPSPHVCLQTFMCYLVNEVNSRFSSCLLSQQKINHAYGLELWIFLVLIDNWLQIMG